MLTTTGLTVAFGGVHACDDVSLTFEAGTTTAVVGPNGAGKSTLLQLLSGVLAPQAGTISLRQRNITRMSPDRRCSLGIGRTFQTARVFPGLTVWEATLLGAYTGAARSGRARARTARVLAADRATRALELFGERLLPRRDDLTYSLSYANRRRCELARVLAGDPDVLLLDEPTAGMNPTETNELTGILASLSQARPDLTVILVEHKMAVVRALSSRTVVMDAGRVIADGAPDDVLSRDVVIEAYLGRADRRG